MARRTLQAFGLIFMMRVMIPLLFAGWAVIAAAVFLFVLVVTVLLSIFDDEYAVEFFNNACREFMR